MIYLNLTFHQKNNYIELTLNKMFIFDSKNILSIFNEIIFVLYM
jgi:hypothetical protein